jgi:hypothetical protein
MADDLPEYKSWLLKQPCACSPCVAAVVVHHHTGAPTYAPGARPEKAAGGKRGKGQRASDYYGIPLCNRHHGQLHALSVYFKGWSGPKLKAWQDGQVERLRSLYDGNPTVRHVYKVPPLARLDELATLFPEGYTDSVRLHLPAGDLRDLVSLIPAVLAAEKLRDSLNTDGQELTQPVWDALEEYDLVRPESAEDTF